MLKQSLDIGFSAEPKFVVPMYRRLDRFGSLEDPAKLRRLAEAIHGGLVFEHLHTVVGISSRAEEIVERVRAPTYAGVLYAVFQLLADKRGQSRLGYKNPADVIHLPLLAELLPTARFVHIIRDGRDVGALAAQVPVGFDQSLLRIPLLGANGLHRTAGWGVAGRPLLRVAARGPGLRHRAYGHQPGRVRQSGEAAGIRCGTSWTES